MSKAEIDGLLAESKAESKAEADNLLAASIAETENLLADTKAEAAQRLAESKAEADRLLAGTKAKTDLLLEKSAAEVGDVDDQPAAMQTEGELKANQRVLELEDEVVELKKQMTDLVTAFESAPEDNIDIEDCY